MCLVCIKSCGYFKIFSKTTNTRIFFYWIYRDYSASGGGGWFLAKELVCGKQISISIFATICLCQRTRRHTKPSIWAQYFPHVRGRALFFIGKTGWMSWDIDDAPNVTYSWFGVHLSFNFSIVLWFCSRQKKNNRIKSYHPFYRSFLHSTDWGSIIRCEFNCTKLHGKSQTEIHKMPPGELL